MQDSVYSALFGGLTAEHRLNVIANNLANVSTSGFKRDQTSFEDTFIRFASDYAMDARQNLREEPLWPDSKLIAKPRIGEARTDFTQGHLRQTGNPLDVALSGKGFFAIQTPQGEMYTRNGNFYLSNDGRLINGDGYPVMGGGGPIEIPPGASLRINEAGDIQVDGATVETLKVVSFADEGVLEHFGKNLFRVSPQVTDAAQQEPDMTETMVNQGYLEEANVEVVTEMVAMIEVNRAFEAYQKVMQTAQQNDEKSIREVGTNK